METMQASQQAQYQKAIRIYLIVTAAAGLAVGITDMTFSNFFKEVYQVGALERGFIEFPRELPGMLCMFVIASLSSLGDIKSSIFAHTLSFIGIIAMAVLKLDFRMMIVFLFINSLGMHTYLPLGDSIGLSLSKGVHVGTLMGKFNSVKTAFTMFAGIITFIGFKSGIFSFKTPIVIFLISGIGSLMSICALTYLLKSMPNEKSQLPKKFKFVFRKQYSLYYLLCSLYGARKQIMMVYSPWVLIELLNFKADTMAILTVIGSFIGIFFMPLVGRWTDKYGHKRVMMAEALCFFVIYILYGFLSATLAANTLTVSMFVLGFVFFLYIIDKMTAQFAMVRTIYMRSIALAPEDVTPSLSLGISIDHLISILGSAVCGYVWFKFGPQYVFVIAAVMSILNLFAVARIKPNAALRPFV